MLYSQWCFFERQHIAQLTGKEICNHVPFRIIFRKVIIWYISWYILRKFLHVYSTFVIEHIISQLDYLSEMSEHINMQFLDGSLMNGILHKVKVVW